jgi:hypothetical protein
MVNDRASAPSQLCPPLRLAMKQDVSARHRRPVVVPGRQSNQRRVRVPMPLEGSSDGLAPVPVLLCARALVIIRGSGMGTFFSSPFFSLSRVMRLSVSRSSRFAGDARPWLPRASRRVSRIRA